MAYELSIGSNAYLTTSTTPINSWPLTIACWFKTTDISNTMVLVSLTSPTQTLERFLLSAAGGFAGDPVRTNYINSSGTNYAVNSSSGYIANNWTHACCVHASGSSRSAYINGGSAQTDTSSATLSNSGISQINIGRQVYNGPASQYSGQIAEVGIWNAALTAAEIASLAKGMTCDKVRPESLVFYAPLVRDLIDAKGGLLITNNNGATVAAHTRVYA